MPDEETFEESGEFIDAENDLLKIKNYQKKFHVTKINVLLHFYRSIKCSLSRKYKLYFCAVMLNP